MCISSGKVIVFGQSEGPLGGNSLVPKESGRFLWNVFSLHHSESTDGSSEFQQGQNPSELELAILSLLQL